MRRAATTSRDTGAHEPESRWSPVLVGAFELAAAPWMRSRLRVRLGPLPRDGELPPDRPLILVANHTSWWDGFVLRAVQRRLRPRAPLYTVMTSRELARFRALRWMGALDVGPASPAALRRTLRFLQRARTHRPELVVAMFPQGRLLAARRRPLDFRRGVTAVARRLAPATVVPVALAYETFASPVLSAYVALGTPIAADDALDLGALEDAVTRELDGVAAFLDAHGEHAPALWDGLARGPA